MEVRWVVGEQQGGWGGTEGEGRGAGRARGEEVEGCAGLAVLLDALLLAYSKRQPKGCLSLI